MLRTRIAWVVAWIVLWRAAPAQAQMTRLVIGTEARTIASNGGGTAASLTFTPLTSHVAITCDDPDGCAITLGEISLPGPTINGRTPSFRVEIVNVSANAVTFADSAGVQELQSSVSLAQYASLVCAYETDRWACGNAGGGSGTVTTTGSPASGNLTAFSGAASITNTNLTGDVTTTNTVATTIAAAAVTYAKFQNLSALSVFARSANSSGVGASVAASAASGAVLRESGSTIGFGTIATAGIADDAVTYAKLENLAATRLLGRGSAGGTGDPEPLTLGAGLSLAGTVLNASVIGSGAGVVVQVKNTQTGAVATGTTTVPVDDTIPQNTEGNEVMTLAITPTSATNYLRIDVVVSMSNSAANRYQVAALFQDTTANALAAIVQYEPNAGTAVNQKFSHYMVAGTTSATTFKVRCGSQAAGTMTFNGEVGARLFGGVMVSSITISEIVP